MAKKKWKVVDTGQCVFIDTTNDGTYSGIIYLPGNHEEQLQKATLMAAAPELLESLMEAVYFWNPLVQHRNSYDRAMDAIAKAQRIIAKAKGEGSE